MRQQTRSRKMQDENFPAISSVVFVNVHISQECCGDQIQGQMAPGLSTTNLLITPPKANPIHWVLQISNKLYPNQNLIYKTYFVQARYLWHMRHQYQKKRWP